MWKLVGPSSQVCRVGLIVARFRIGVGPAVETSWGTVIRVGPGFWPGDVACPALGFVVVRRSLGAVAAPAEW